MFFCCCREDLHSAEEVVPPLDVKGVPDVEWKGLGSGRKERKDRFKPVFSEDTARSVANFATLPTKRPEVVSGNADRDRLKSLVKRFAKEAFRGMPVVLLEFSEASVDAILRLDRHFAYFEVQKDTGHSVTFFMKEIASVRYGQDVGGDIPPQLREACVSIELYNDREPLVFIFRQNDVQIRFYLSLAILRYVALTESVPLSSFDSQRTSPRLPRRISSQRSTTSLPEDGDGVLLSRDRGSLLHGLPPTVKEEGSEEGREEEEEEQQRRRGSSGCRVVG